MAPEPQPTAVIIATLRDEIVSLRLEPGETLDLPAMRGRFGVSSTPLRDALMVLAGEGLVEILPRRATRVTLIDPAPITRALLLSLVLDLEAVRMLAIAADMETVEALRERARRLSVAAEAGHAAAFTEGDRAFHAALREAAGFDDLGNLMAAASRPVQRLDAALPPSAAAMQAIQRQHHAILDAVASRRPVDAQAALRAHHAAELPSLGVLHAARPGWFPKA
jgi:DNA-binding GntR family transcriptional regulator